ncbi:MAG TPA: MOSC domain-containing protein [Candidatus Acidoferrales bacterium]|nr:MOSC domain-containing protein [Candidatus Acidoferrales bacterium]
MILGEVAQIWRFPVKALKGELLRQAGVGPHGLVGDRGAALFVLSPDHARTGKTYRGKENERLHLLTGIDDALELGAQRSVSLEARDAGPYFDDQPVSLILDTWLAEAEALAGRSLEALRYRPNIFVQTTGEVRLQEADLVGSRITVGDVVLHVNAEIRRCVTTTYDLETGDSDPRVLRELAQHRRNVMGVYCNVLQAGVFAHGDQVRVSASSVS